MAKNTEPEDLQAAESQRAGADQKAANRPPEFRRLPNGDVELETYDDTFTIPELDWTQIVASVSAGGGSISRSSVALDFHRSVGRVQLTSFEWETP